MRAQCCAHTLAASMEDECVYYIGQCPCTNTKCPKVERQLASSNKLEDVYDACLHHLQFSSYHLMKEPEQRDVALKNMKVKEERWEAEWGDIGDTSPKKKAYGSEDSSC